MKKSSFVALAFVAAIAGVWFVIRPTPVGEANLPNGGSTVAAEVRVPDSLSPNAQAGKALFEVNCAACHGENASGNVGEGPPLVHKIYEPSHHSDEAFQRAVALGVRAHHWRFGNMPRVDGLSREDVAQIVDYVRALQRENGIE